MIHTTDQLGNVIKLAQVPRRIVSLVPSQTELLFALGAGDSVVGVTRYCTHPVGGVAGLARIGGTKRFHFDRIDRLQPDLILGNLEENYREGIERLQRSYPVWISDIRSLADALSMIRSVGRLVGQGIRSDALAAQIEARFSARQPAPSRRAAYLIWRDPWMVAASATFIDDMMARCGLKNVFADQSRYPQVSLAMLRDRQPEYVLLSSEPYSFDATHRDEIVASVPGTQVLFVDGMMFSWYGSRLLETPAYLRGLAAAWSEIPL